MSSSARTLAFLILAFSLLPGTGVSSSTPSEVKMMSVDAGGTAADPSVEVRTLDGVSLNTAVRRAISEEAFQTARMELTSARNLRQDTFGAVAFTGNAGTEGSQIEVVLIPFPDKNNPEDKMGMMAVARSGRRTAVSYCVLESAVTPSEIGAVGLEIPIDDPQGKKLWLWQPDDASQESVIGTAQDDVVGTAQDSVTIPPAVKMYFKCAFDDSKFRNLHL